MRVLVRLSLTLLLFAPSCRSPVPEAVGDATSVRTLSSGAVVGREGSYGDHAWLGIPYARPPVGELRWRAPRPPLAWTGTREALAFGPRCPQLASALDRAGEVGERIGDEDCLTLNVYAPRFAPGAVPQGDARLPVMVWIHGGGNTIGGSSFYDGGNLATTHGLVIVTINYRLGPLGWLRHSSLRGEGTTPEDRSGNYGTLDMVRALHWVQENAAAFGGDPGNVTVFGESAGGSDTLILLVSPLSKGLLHRAIVQSGGTSRSTPAEAERLADAADAGHRHSSSEILVRLLQERGLARDRTSAIQRLEATSGAEIAALLRETRLDTLFSLYLDDEEGLEAGMLDMPGVFAEGTVIPARPTHELLADGAQHRIPVILGSNRDENKLFMFSDPSHVRQLLGFLPRLRDAEHYDAVAHHLSRGWKADAVDELAARLRRSQGESVYAYRFDWDEEPTVLGADLSRMLGASHAFEIPFVFGHWNLGPEGEQLFSDGNEPGRDELSAAMMSYWAEFAYTGSPGHGRDGSLPEWKAWGQGDAAAPKFLVLDTSQDGGIRMSSDTVSIAQIASDVAADARFDEEERCVLLEQLVAWWPRVSEGVAGTQLACAPVSPGGSATAGGE